MYIPSIKNQISSSLAKFKYNKYMKITRDSLKLNDVTDESTKAIETLISQSHNGAAYIELVLLMVDSADIKDPLTTQFISHFLEVTALPNTGTIKKLNLRMLKKLSKCRRTNYEGNRMLTICAIIWSQFGEKLAGKVGEMIFTDAIIQVLLENLKSLNFLQLTLFSLIALENFSLTKANKDKLLKLGYRKVLDEVLDSFNSMDTSIKKSFFGCEILFCLKSTIQFFTDHKKEKMNRPDIKKLFAGTNCTIDWTTSSSFWKFSEDLLEFRNDRNGFATAIGSTCVTDGKWFFEIELVGGGIMQIGWATQFALFKPEDGIGVGDEGHSFGYDGLRNFFWCKGESIPYGPCSWKPGDIVGCYLNIDSGALIYYINGVDIGTAYMFEEEDLRQFCEIEGGLRPSFSATSYQQGKVNFGSNPFKFPPSAPFALLNDYGQLTETNKLGPIYFNVKLLYPDEDDEEDMSLLCQICYLNPGKIKIMPCNHEGLCMDCVTRMDCCPFCRNSISSWMVLKK